MPFEIIRNDITDLKVDVIVNSCDPNPVVGGGVDLMIHQKAGAKLLSSRQKRGALWAGETFISDAYELKAKCVIHTVAPFWIDGLHNEEELLKKCYQNSLELAKSNDCSSLAFPLIATGSCSFPKDRALSIAIREIGSFLLKNEMDIYLVVFDKTSFVLSEKLFKNVKSYIDDNYAKELKTRYQIKRFRSPSFDNIEFGSVALKEDSLEELLDELDDSFSKTLLRLIDESGKKDSDIYKKANVDRKLFSKIRNNPDYQPSKKTAIAFAMALELDLEKTRDFIATAGYTLSKSSKFDVIVEYFIIHQKYDLFELNEVLFAFDESLIGV